MLRKLIVSVMCISLTLLGTNLAFAIDAVRIPVGDLRVTDGDIRLPALGKGIVFSDGSAINKLTDAQGIPGPQGDPGPQGIQGIQGPQGLPGAAGGISGTQIVQQSNSGTGFVEANALCPAGMVVTGGGVTQNNGGSGNLILTNSWPCFNSTTSWCGSGINMGGGTIQSFTLTTYAVCAVAASTPPNINATVLRFPGNAAPFGWLQQVDVYSDSQQSAPITNAVVTVNGSSMTYNPSNQSYESMLDIPLGAPVTIAVTVGGVTYTVSGTQVTVLPTTSTPSPNAIWQANAANAITWTDGAPLSGTGYLVGVMGNTGFVYPAGDTGPLVLPISPASHTVPANSVTAGSYQVLVGIGSQISIANAAPGSNFFLAGFAMPVAITVQ